MGERTFTSERWLLGTILVAFLLTGGLAGADLLADAFDGTPWGHLVLEGTILVVGFVAAGLVAKKLVTISRVARAATESATALEGQLRKSAADAARWQTEARDLIMGLGRAMDKQFDSWLLSPAEKEVALLLLKGLSHKEVAEVRTVTEATARQQARAVYKKAGLTGRHDLSAFFLEDLLLPTKFSD